MDALISDLHHVTATVSDAQADLDNPGVYHVVHGLIDDLIAAGVPAERIALLGFSQGACLARTAESIT